MPHVRELPASEPVSALPTDLYRRVHDLIAGNLDRVFPAASLTIVRDGEVVLNAGWGWIDPDTRRLPTQTDTLFDLASVTKLFATSAFLALVGAGRVRLDDALVSIVPEFGASGPRGVDGGQDPHSKAMLPTAPEMEARQIDPARVTFRQLLTHTSGLAPWRDLYRTAGPVPAPPNAPEPVPRALRWQRAIERICQSPFVDEPGRRVHYSDLGIMMLSEALARLHGAPTAMPPDKSISGHSLNASTGDAAVQARVLTPLGLSAAYNPVRDGRERNMIAPTEDDPGWRGRRCQGEVHDENTSGVGGVSGHAGLFGTTRDVAALGQAWLDDDARLGISPAVMDDARREQAETDGERRGLGWLLKARADSSAGDAFSPASYGHTGFTGTSLWIDPARRLVVACMTNRVYYGRDATGITLFRRALHDLIAEGFEPL